MLYCIPALEKAASRVQGPSLCPPEPEPPPIQPSPIGLICSPGPAVELVGKTPYLP